MISRAVLATFRRRSVRQTYVAPKQSWCGCATTAASDAARAEVSPVVSAKTAQRLAIVALGGVGAAALYWGLTESFSPNTEQTTYTNWSQTHEVTPWQCLTPESEKDVERIVAECHAKAQPMRVVGSGLSPNGIAFTNQTMIDMSLMDKILHVDSDKKQVRIQCGARIEGIVEALRAYGLTLQNYASIKEQQLGGFMQVSAHGTGARIPPVDEQVVSMKIVTPGMGTIELSKYDPDPSLFRAARVGLGSFGVVTEVTIQCVAEHKLVETSFVTTLKEIKKHHARWLAENQHLRYLWIPYTSSVVVVTCNPITALNMPRSVKPKHTPVEQTSAMRSLIMTEAVNGVVNGHSEEQLQELSFTDLRGMALSLKPFDLGWLKKVNAAEEDFWKKSSGVRVGWSDQILGFDCGGQQWVLEVAFPTGTLTKPSLADLDFIQDVLQLIERHGLLAAAPVEHRWSSASSSYLSPAYSTNKDDVYSWLGIITYLPTEDPKVRDEITKKFEDYSRRMEVELLPKYNGTWHWAKLEIDRIDHAFMRKRLRERFPMELVVAHRNKLDPKNVLTNRITGAIFDAM